jgi:hypothetical protein
VINHPTSLRSQIKSLEEQLRVLYALAPLPATSGSEGAYTLADLEGLLHGQTDTAEAEIDAVLYQEPPEKAVAWHCIARRSTP